ncbi:MAG TPA: metallophosphoesterase [Chthoniobacterales bacterium]
MQLTLDQGPFLILSDFHIGHQATLVTDIELVAPLFSKEQTVIFNGDTFEMRLKSSRERALHHAKRLKQIISDCGAQAQFICGNHDPMISGTSHAEFVDQAILITHGDILYHDVAPWSLNARLYDRAHRSELHRLPAAEHSDLTSRLGALRRATLAYDVEHVTAPPGIIGSLVHFVETTWPPWRPISILKSWAEVPARAEALARQFRPKLRYLIIGHTHKAGIWRRGDLTIINTGAVMRGFGRQAILFEDSKLTVRQIDYRKNKFQLGKTIQSLPVNS